MAPTGTCRPGTPAVRCPTTTTNTCRKKVLSRARWPCAPWSRLLFTIFRPIKWDNDLFYIPYLISIPATETCHNPIQYSLQTYIFNIIFASMPRYTQVTTTVSIIYLAKISLYSLSPLAATYLSNAFSFDRPHDIFDKHSESFSCLLDFCPTLNYFIYFRPKKLIQPN